jgi:hypothetical protein
MERARHRIDDAPREPAVILPRMSLLPGLGCLLRLVLLAAVLMALAVAGLFVLFNS